MSTRELSFYLLAVLGAITSFSVISSLDLDVINWHSMVRLLAALGGAV